MLLLSKVSKPYDPQIGEEIIGKNYAYQMISLGATGFFKDKEFNSYAGTGSLCGVFDDYNGDNFDCSDLTSSTAETLHSVNMVNVQLQIIRLRKVPPLGGNGKLIYSRCECFPS